MKTCPMCGTLLFDDAEKCTKCGACEKACPMEIPLASLQRFIREDILELFNYTAGEDVSELAPLITTLEEGPIKEVEE